MTHEPEPTSTPVNGASIDAVAATPASVLTALGQEIEAAGGEWQEPPEYEGSVGRTMFDSPSSEDGSLTVLLPRDNIDKFCTQAIVRIRSVPDGRTYLGAVVQGPFADPDGLRADAPIIAPPPSAARSSCLAIMAGCRSPFSVKSSTMAPWFPHAAGRVRTAPCSC